MWTLMSDYAGAIGALIVAIIGFLVNWGRQEVRAGESLERAKSLETKIDKNKESLESRRDEIAKELRDRITYVAAAHSALREEIAGTYVKREDWRIDLRDLRAEMQQGFSQLMSEVKSQGVRLENQGARIDRAIGHREINVEK